MSIHFRLKGQTYVCNLCGDKCESDGLPDWWTEIENKRTETIQHLCVSCSDDAIKALPRVPLRKPSKQCQPPHTS